MTDTTGMKLKISNNYKTCAKQTCMKIKPQKQIVAHRCTHVSEEEKRLSKQTKKTE